MHQNKIYILLIIFLIISSKSEGQKNNKNFDVTDKYNYEFDTILYVQEMSNYLDTLFLSRYENEILKYENEDKIKGIKKGQILFLGSSSIRRWHSLKKDLYPITTINRGFGGSTLPEAIYFFNRIVIPYQPSAIVLYEGDNDVMASFLTPDIILKTFDLFVRMTKIYLPDTHIYFLSIKPSPAREKFIDKMMITNMKIEEYCKSNKNLNYIDITEAMFDNKGNIRNDIFQKDNLHMNKKGYEIWTKIIKKALLN